MFLLVVGRFHPFLIVILDNVHGALSADTMIDGNSSYTLHPHLHSGTTFDAAFIRVSANFPHGDILHEDTVQPDLKVSLGSSVIC